MLETVRAPGPSLAVSRASDARYRDKVFGGDIQSKRDGGAVRYRTDVAEGG